MSLAQTANGLNRFFARHGMDAKGVRVIVEFDDLDKALRALDCAKRDLLAQMYDPTLAPPKQIEALRVYDVAFDFTAKIK